MPSHSVPSHLTDPQTSGTVGTVERRQASEFCSNDGDSEEWMVAIGNEAEGGMSAAAISANQVCTCVLCFHCNEEQL